MSDPFGKGVLAAGVSRETIEKWSGDSQVSVEGETAQGKTMSVFDTLEDLDADAVLYVSYRSSSYTCLVRKQILTVSLSSSSGVKLVRFRSKNTLRSRDHEPCLRHLPYELVKSDLLIRIAPPKMIVVDQSRFRVVF